MLLYKLIKPYSTLGVKTFFRKIYFHNDDYIPKDKPVLITCNHPTAFLDPVIMACMLKQTIHFMVRGDVFKHPFYRKMLESLNMIPIYRIKEGFSNLKNNFATMDYVSDLLSKNERVLIFAEGSCIQEKRLRPIQKGAARMAFSAIEKHGDLDIFIVPAGVNYTFKTQVRDIVKFEFGEPIRIADYKEMHAENPNKAIKEITEEIENRMKKLVVHIEDNDDRKVYDQIQEIVINTINAPTFPIKDRDIVPIRYDRLIANKLNSASKEEKDDLKAKCTQYFGQLQEKQLTDYGVLHFEEATWKANLNLILGVIPNLIGWVMGNPFWQYGKKVAKKAKDIEYFASIWFGVSFLAFLVFYIFWIIAAIVVMKLTFTIFVVLIPYFCFFHINYLDFYNRLKQVKKGKQLPQNQRDMLLSQRNEIFKLIK